MIGKEVSFMNLALVYSVFNEDFTVKACGRKLCSDLIAHLSSLYPDINFGNENTGVMNVENIRKIVKGEV
jgi:hypothetical protein